MDTESTLYPPNMTRFSDHVIGDVIQRSRLTFSTGDDPRLPLCDLQSSSTMKSASLDSLDEPNLGSYDPDSTQSALSCGGTVVGTDQTRAKTLPRSKRLPRFKRLPRSKRLPRDTSTRSARIDSTTSPKDTVGRQDDQVVHVQALAERQLLRERNRIHQARYKRRQKIRLMSLQNNILELRQQIEDLSTQHRVLFLTSETMNTSMWGVVVEYFRLFRNGHNLQGAAFNTFGALGPQGSQVQHDFLQATMAGDVCLESGYGIKAMQKSWAYASLCFRDFDMKLVRLEKDAAENALIATMECTMSINENTLRYAFPHVAYAERGKLSLLASKCLGKQLVIHGSTRFCWDSDKGQMVGVYYKADMMTPLLQLLGNLESVSDLLSGARITPECTFSELQEWTPSC